MTTMRSDRKPPLARSPMRLRPRRVLRSTTNTVQTPPGSLTKTQMPTRTCWAMEEESELRPEYLTISCELRALAKMVHDEFGNVGFTNPSTKTSSPLFERGRFYEEYSARRNERLKRKNGKTGDERRTVYDLGVKVESVKRRDTKKLEGLRKSTPSTPMTGLRENPPRYLLRSSTREGIKKPPLPVSVSFDKKSVACSDRKTASRRVRKI